MADYAMERVLDSARYSPIASVITNPRRPDNPIEIANPAFCTLTGYAEPEALGRNARFLAGDQTEPWITEQVRTAIRNRRSIFVDILNFKKDGTAFRNGMMIAPLFNATGELVFFFGSQVDLGPDSKQHFSARRIRAAALVEGLAPRQRQVLAGMTQGLLNKQIAHDLGLAEKTVHMHRSLVLERLDVQTTAEAIRIGVEAGL